MQMEQRLYDLRQKTGESLSEVAAKVGVSKAHIWELEKGRSKNPSFELVRKLAEHYGVSIDVLTGSGDAPAQGELEIGRIHRGLEALSDGDRKAVQSLIDVLRSNKENAS